ncbi:hypothetical protein [Nitrosomonas communis]|uniref:Uracil DNA glycosylase superfamily protein n=1 Tax=Nitrosomonas communis TaxID=44574 RepID=A0A1I4QJ72_9PROT|nr:hypothetical protein [Nitrosomonas communis]SFM40074.1 hypothetical protein SAMN05421863_10274 [Nitrosomonas communis]
MNYLNHLYSLDSLPLEEKERRKNELIETTPEKLWPDGMPASIDPKIVLIGVSYGNSPNPEAEKSRKNGFDFYSEPCVIKPKNSYFYYPDARGYWEKLRYLSHSFCQKNCPTITIDEALSLTTHINLGTDSAGAATKYDVEKPYVQWASRLLNNIHNPDLVVLFGLKKIMKDKEVSQWWNHESGLKIDWNKPEKEKFFINYRFSLWDLYNSNNHRIRLVLWPNHPSRHPFANLDIWKESVNEFLSTDNL